MKKIELTQNKFALVDNEDFEWLNKFKWYAHKRGNTYYVERAITILSSDKEKNIKRKQRIMYIHRLILEKKLRRKLKSWEQVDHIDGCGLNNKRNNLRLANVSQNGFNSKKQEKYGNKKTTSKYKGICWHEQTNKWLVRIGFNGNRIHIGYFNNEIDAAKAYDKAALKYFGEYANPNFDF